MFISFEVSFGCSPYIWRGAEQGLSDCGAQDLILHLLYMVCSDLRKKSYILKEYLKDRILVLAAD